MEFKEGIYENLDYPTYDSIPAWRSHDLTSIAKCPFTWKNRTFNNSPALLEGRVQHTVFLEHHKFFDEFAIEPPVDRRTKAGKQEYAEWLEDLGDKTPCKQDMYDICMERREVVSDFIPEPDHRVELTLCWMWNGQPCKGKLDWHTGTDIWDSQDLPGRLTQRLQERDQHVPIPPAGCVLSGWLSGSWPAD
jgi:hypothetical protein